MQIDDSAKGRLETWSVEETADAFGKGEIVLIDVRTPQEYLMERIPGAMNYPMQEFDPATLPGETVKRIVFHCGSGARSENVARQVLEAGHDKVAHMGGGFQAWKKAELEHVETSPVSGAPVHKGRDFKG